MSVDTPRPKGVHYDCHHPEEIGWVRGARRLVVALLLMLLGSIGGGVATALSLAAQAAEVRALQTYAAGRQVEDRSRIDRLEANQQQRERETAQAIERVAVEIAGLRAEVRAMALQQQRAQAPVRGRP